MNIYIIDKFSNAIKNNNFSEMISICNDKNNRLIISPGVSTLFNDAFKKNNINIVKWFLTFKPLFNIEFDKQLLYTQWQKNNFKIIKLYLEYNPKCDISTILKYSICNGNVEFSDFLLKYNELNNITFEINTKILRNICENGHIKMLDYLLNKYNNLAKNMIDIIDYKCINNLDILKTIIKYYPEFFKQVIEKENLKHETDYLEMIEDGELNLSRNELNLNLKINFFSKQCRYGNFEIVKLIYDNYPEVIKYDWALIWACEKGYIEIAKWLLEKRLETLIQYPKDIWEFAFIWSCRYGKLDVLKWIYLINPDININADCGDNNDQDFDNVNMNGFTYACIEGKLDVAKWLLEIDSEKTLSSIDTFNTFVHLCKYKKYYNIHDDIHFDPLPILKWLLEIKPDINISVNNEQAFYTACYHGSIEVAKWLLEIKPNINISINNDYIFRECCNGIESNYTTIKWLLEIKPDINIEANNHNAFKNACEYDAIEIANFLISLNPTKYHIKIGDYSRIESWKIMINYVRKEMIKLKEEDKIECPICMGRKSQAITNCKHQYCFNCIKKINETENKCPMCRCLITDLFKII